MNKMMTAAVIAGGLLLANSPEAAAHKEVRVEHRPPAYHYTYVDVRRSKSMPRWLKRNRGFRHWYRHTPLKYDRRIAWYQLFDIYRWERRWGSHFSRHRSYRDDDYAYRYGERHYDRGRRDGRRHRH